MSKNGSNVVSINKKAAAVWVTTGAIVILILSGWLWFHSVYMSSNNVFWGMLDNNLATTSVTEHVTQIGQAQSVEQYIQKQFGAQNSVHSLISLKQKQGKTVATVKSETIGTLSADYSRYLSVDRQRITAKGQPEDFSSVVGLWVKTDIKNNQAASNQSFKQNVLGVVPFANLNSDQRQNIIKMLRDKDVYDISTGSIKSISVNGRPAFVYDVNIKPKAYIEVMIQVVRDMGLGNIGLDASQYDNSSTYKAQFTVDKLSRHLVKITYSATSQITTYSSQGLEQKITLPTNTITMAELQKRIQKVIR